LRLGNYSDIAANARRIWHLTNTLSAVVFCTFENVVYEDLSVSSCPFCYVPNDALKVVLLGVNSINFIRSRFSYERRFGSFF